VDVRGPRALWLLGLSVFHSVGSLLQQYCGEGSCMVVALLVWWCLPSLLLYQHLITLEIC
jgi:hypothetical protein